MSDLLMPHLVSTQRVRGVFGSNDPAVARDILAGRAQRVASLDEFLLEAHEESRDEDDDEQADTPAPTIAGTLADLIAGHPASDPRQYAAWLSTWELVCDTFGERLPESWNFRMDWVEPFDELLKSLGLSIQLIDLSYSSPPPFPLPPNPDTGMAVGHWSSAAIAGARARLDTITTEPGDADQRDTLKSIRNWLRAAANIPEPMIVGFCY